MDPVVKPNDGYVLYVSATGFSLDKKASSAVAFITHGAPLSQKGVVPDAMGRSQSKATVRI